jgi:molecular chaperone GrpE
MSDKMKPEPETPAQPETEGAAPAPDAAAPGDPPQEAAEVRQELVPEPDPAVALLEKQVAELNDKLLRALAEAENVRRRAERDREDAFKYAIANFARDVLSVADNLRRAMASVDPATRQSDPAVAKVIEGLELTERQMLATFERYGIRPVKALGERFDHNLHEALFEMEDRARPAGTVVQELETGYLLNDRLLRPAKVGIAKGGARVDRKEEAPPAAAEGPKKGGQAAYETKGKDPGGKLDEKL